MDFKELRESIKNAFSSSDLTPEQAESLGKINAKVDQLEDENNKMIKGYDELRVKYINLVKDTSFKEEPTKQNEDSEPKTMMECLAEERNKSK